MRGGSSRTWRAGRRRGPAVRPLDRLRIRRAETDDELAAWRGVRAAVLPRERAMTVAEMRQLETSDRLVLLAEFDGAVVGSGLADRSSLRDRASVAPRVLPEMRRRGIGTALLRSCVAHVATLGFAEVVTQVDGRDEASIAFARRFGFEEIDREVEQVKVLGDEPPPDFPPGVDALTIAERPELLRQAYELAVQAYADMATPWPATITLAEWLGAEATEPAGSFVALAGGEVVGYSGLLRDADDAGRAEDGLTAVRLDWRRRGLATALKRAELAWASANGIREVYTWTQRGNDAMRRVNELLGYEDRSESLRMVAPVERLESRLETV